MVICLERGADLHMAQLMPLPLTVSCSSKIQIVFTFLVPAHLGSPGQSAVKRVCVCVYVTGSDSANGQTCVSVSTQKQANEMTCDLDIQHRSNWIGMLVQPDSI